MLRLLSYLFVAALLAVPLGSRADVIALADAASGDNSSGSFVVTNHVSPFQVSNDGRVEHRAAVEFDLRDILSSPSTRITSATFTVSGTVDSTKTLFIHLYGSNDGVVTDADLDLGSQFDSVALTSAAGTQEITFDVSGFLVELDGSYPPYLGINLRESVSGGNIVAFEYLLVATILNLSAVPEPGSLILLGLGLAGLALSRRMRA